MVSNETLWREFVAGRDPALRERLVLMYAPLVRYVVNSMSLSLPRLYSMDDVLGHGTVGLLHAVDRYDPDRAVSFETYAIPRIRGAIVDAIRQLSTFSRGETAKIRNLDKAAEELTAELGRFPEEHEIAERLDISMEGLGQLLAMSNLTLTSLDATFDAAEEDRGGSIQDLLADERSPDPHDIAERGELRQALGQAIHKLPHQSKLVLSLYYVDELSPLEIAEVLGISRSRVYQLHTKAIIQLRGFLKPAYEVPGPLAKVSLR